jgi:hypothetical protein
MLGRVRLAEKKLHSRIEKSTERHAEKAEMSKQTEKTKDRANEEQERGFGSAAGKEKMV